MWRLGVKVFFLAGFFGMSAHVQTSYAQTGQNLPPVISGGQQLTSQPSSVNSKLGDLYVQNTQLQAEIRTLTGRIEELQFQLQAQEREYNNKLGDIEFRLDELQETVRLTAPGVASAETGAASQPDGLRDEEVADSPQPSDDVRNATTQVLGQISDTEVVIQAPIQEYEAALQMLRDGQYQQAQLAFTQFLETYPNSNRTAAAYYWLGETYYSQNKYSDAAKNFLTGFEKFPDNTKAPDNLLKLGMSLARLEKNKEACLTFAQLLSKYPNAPQHIKNRAGVESTRVACQT